MLVWHGIQLMSLTCLCAAWNIKSTTSSRELAFSPDIHFRQDIPGALHGRDTDASAADTDPDSETDEAILYAQAQLCNFDRDFGSIDEIQAASDSLSTPCIAIHTLQVLSDMLSTAYDNYTSVNDGYDAEFGYYVTYMKNLIPGVLSDQLMFNISATGQYDDFAILGNGMNCEYLASPCITTD